jgi:hypothetical protein
MVKGVKKIYEISELNNKLPTLLIEKLTLLIAGLSGFYASL